MFSFAMTSGLASDSDKLSGKEVGLISLDKSKIIIMLCRAQKFGDTGPYKNFDFFLTIYPFSILLKIIISEN